MKFVAIIPARYASSRFPGKPLAMLAGKPMIQWVCERVSGIVEDCWVATDDRRIADTVESFGGRAVMTSAEHRSGTDRCAEAYEKIIGPTGGNFDVVINVQGDEPFISTEHLTVIKSLFDAPEVQIGTLVKRFGAGEDIFNANMPKVVLSLSGDALYFSRSAVPYLRGGRQYESWSSQHVYYKHIGLYAYLTEVLHEVTRLPQSSLEIAESLEQLRWLENGYRIRAGIVTTETQAVDTPEDMALAEELMRK